MTKKISNTCTERKCRCQKSSISNERPGSYRFTRRFLLRVAGLIAGGASITAVIDACTPQQNQASGENIPIAVPASGSYTEVPPSPMEPPPDRLTFFTPQEAKTVDAFISRLIPGSPSDPGAHEAGVLNYIDKTLSFHNGVVEPAYAKPPFAKAYTGSQPPGSNTKDVIYVKKDELTRYGSQSRLNPQQTYRQGLAALDNYTRQKYGKAFVDLSSDQQDQVLMDMEDGKTTGFIEPTDQGFFKTIHEHTIEGMFSDPGYGGNKDMAGWKLIGYPGAQRAYTPTDLHTEHPVRPPQSLAMLHNFNPGQQANPYVIVPPSSPQEITSNPTH